MKIKSQRNIKKYIKNMSRWLSLYLIEQGYHVDFEADSYKELDRFFDEHTDRSIFDDNDAYIFAFASYSGEVLRHRHRGKWYIGSKINYDNLDDRDIYIKLKNGKLIYPLEAVSLRMKDKMRLEDIISM